VKFKVVTWICFDKHYSKDEHCLGVLPIFRLGEIRELHHTLRRKEGVDKV
jgi:hypothetical protein